MLLENELFVMSYDEEMTLSEYLDELDISEETLEDNVYGL